MSIKEKYKKRNVEKVIGRGTQTNGRPSKCYYGIDSFMSFPFDNTPKISIVGSPRLDKFLGLYNVVLVDPSYRN